MQNQDQTDLPNNGEVGAKHEEFVMHANSKFIIKRENEIDGEEDDVTWSQVFGMMYADVKDAISPLSKIIDYVALDPNEEDSKNARAAFEEKMSKQIKQPIRKYKIGAPGAMHIFDEDSDGAVPNSRNNHQNNMHNKKRGLLEGPREESVRDPREIIESAHSLESFQKSIQETHMKNILRGLDTLKNEKDSRLTSARSSSPEIKHTPSTHCNTDSSPCSDFVSKRTPGSEYQGEIAEMMSKTNLEDGFSLQKSPSDCDELYIPKLSLSERRKSLSKKYSDDNISYRNNSETRLISNNSLSRSLFERNKQHGKFHSHAYTMENLSGTIQRPVSTSREEILKLYSKEELEKIQSFVEKTNELVYEGPLEKKNSWSWGYKLRWVKIYKCEMHYFLSPKESKIKSKTPLGVINFKIAEWSLHISDSDEKTFTITAHANSSNGRGYQWRIPSSSTQSRKSWTNRIEKILKATAFMQQLKGVIKIPL
ncbi:pleckstriny (PH) domain containing protein [Cryptosporidium felis]|nr:pleckstriny (PH) domain containing protein [Cryptosporidium felis]